MFQWVLQCIADLKRLKEEDQHGASRCRRKGEQVDRKLRGSLGEKGSYS